MSQPDIANEVCQEDVAGALEYIKTETSTFTDNADLAHRLNIILQGSRELVDVRKLLGEDQLLLKLCSIVEESILIKSEIGLTALKCIGNSFDGNDAARDVIIEHGIKALKSCLKSTDHEIQSVMVKVLYNFCTDYVPAQQACYRRGILYDLIKLSSQSASQLPMDLLSSLLILISDHKQAIEPALASPLDDETLRGLLKLPELCFDETDSLEDGEVDTYAACIETALTYMRDSTVQRQLIQGRLVDRVWEMLKSLQARIAIWRLDNTTVEDIDNLLVPLASSIGWVLSDLAAGDDFAQVYQLQDGLVVDLIDQIRVVGNGTNGSDAVGREIPAVALSEPACQVLGNLLWKLPPADAAPLVQIHQLHHALLSIITMDHASGDAQARLLHSIAGLLIMLARPSQDTRVMIGQDPLAKPAMEKLCAYGMVEVQQDGVKLLKELGKDCPPNQEQFRDLAQQTLQALSDARKSAAITESSS